MHKKDLLTNLLAVVGNVLVWFPIFVLVVTSVASHSLVGRFVVDYMIPAELFLFVLAGGSLLLWAAVRAKSRRGLIGWSLAAAVALLLGGQALAVVTGLASGEREPTGLPFILVMSTLAIFDLLVLLVGIAGILLLRDVFRAARPPAEGTIA